MSTVKDMKPEVVEQWVKDLRSGEFTQIYGNLVDLDRGEKCRCALGVLLYRAEEAGAVERRFDAFGKGPTSTLDNGGDWEAWSDSSLPTAAQEWAGIPGDSNPEIEYGDSFETVIDLNDNHFKSFEELADLIEANLASS